MPDQLDLYFSFIQNFLYSLPIISSFLFTTSVLEWMEKCRRIFFCSQRSALNREKQMSLLPFSIQSFLWVEKNGQPPFCSDCQPEWLFFLFFFSKDRRYFKRLVFFICLYVRFSFLSFRKISTPCSTGYPSNSAINHQLANQLLICLKYACARAREKERERSKSERDKKKLRDKRDKGALEWNGAEYK